MTTPTTQPWDELVHEAIESSPDEPGRPPRLSVADRAALLDDAVEMLVVLDRSGQLLHANRSASDVLGWVPDDGPTPIVEFIHPDDRSSMRFSLEQFVAGSPMRRKRLRIRHRGQRWVWVEILSRNRLGVPGVDGIVITARDVSDQVAAERRVAESEQRFRSLITASTDAVIMAEPDGTVLYTSPRAETLLAGAGASVGGLASAIHPDDVERARACFAAARDGAQGSQHELVLRVPAASGEWRWMESWIVNQLGVPGVDSLVIYGRDITASRRTEAMLRSRLEADDLVARISARFVEVSADQIDQAIEESLAALGTFARADRAWIFQLHRDHRHIDHTHEWCAPGITSVIDDLQGLRIEDLPGFAEWIGDPSPLLIGSVAAMGDDLAAERTILEDQGIRSMAAQAMFVKGELYGLIGLDAVTEEVQWPEQVVWALEACANIFGSALRRCEAETELAMNEARFRAMVDHAADGVRVLDGELRSTYISPAVLRITGCQAEDLVDPGIRLLQVHPDDRDFVEECRRQVLARPGELVTGTFRMLRPDGTWVHLEEISTNLLEDPAVRGIVVNVRDVTERHRHEAELVEQARRDPLTGLPNRLLFDEMVDAALARRQLTGAQLAVLSFDLDRFKLINDSLGHQTGDAVLVEAGERLRGALRGGDVVARLGGDEFAMLCEPIERDEIPELVDSIVERFREPFNVGDHRFYATAAVGVAVSDHQTTRSSLVRAADTARAEAKASGGDRGSVFAGELADTASERIQLEAGLRRALDVGELVLHYQPIIDLGSGSVVGAEALLRWQHPTRGLLAPAAFLEVAEQTGLIGPIGEWVMGEATNQLADWTRSAALDTFTMHINVSVRQLADGGVAATIARMIDMFDIEPGQLCVEITESTLLAGQGPIEELAAIQAAGVLVALDDFGTGHSSFAYLRHLAIDVLKIDRQFVDGLTVSNSDTAIVTAIVSLAQSLGLTTVGEGVETVEQLEALRSYGCDHAQGYLFARALPAEAFLDHLGGHHGY
ncbi:MAG: EAL domain-containing protein [Acidimicrobiales bacterium]